MLRGCGVDVGDCCICGEEIGEGGEGFVDALLSLSLLLLLGGAATEGVEEVLDEGGCVLGVFGRGGCGARWKKRRLAYLFSDLKQE